MAALEGALDLGAIAGIFFLIGCLFVVAFTFQKLADVLNFSVFGVHPLKNVAVAIEHTIVAGCNDGIAKLEKWAVALESGLIDSFGMLIAIPALALLGVKAAFQYLWGELVKPLVHAAAKDVRAVATEALELAHTVEKTVGREVARLESMITGAIKTAEHAAHTFTVQEIATLEHALEREIGAVQDLIPQAVKDAARAADLVTGETLGRIAAGENAAIDALQRAEAATAAELHDALAGLDKTQLAGLLASVPLLAQLVQTITAESGLDNANCRSKVKNICSTDSSLWGELLGGFVAMEVAFNLRDLIEFGNELVEVIAPEIRAIEAA